MTKAELIDAVQAAAGDGVSKKQVGELIDAAFDTIGSTVAKEGSFRYPGFGTFKISERAARKGRNPQTGAAMDIPASKTVRFKPAAALKGSL